MSPTISRLLGITIRLYYEEHGVPHFRAHYGEFNSAISIETLEVLQGELPPRVRALVLEWAAEQRAGLRENWRRAQAHQTLRRLDPLE